MPVVIVAACLSLACVTSSVETLAYDRAAIANGQWWRLVTGHFVHLSIAHGVVDCAGLLLVAWIFGSAFGPWSQSGAGLVGIVTIDAGLWFLHPEVTWYVGLSGALHAWFVAGAATWATDARRDRRAWGVVLLLGLVVKLSLELGHAAFWSVGMTFDVVTAAHRWGAAGGAAYAVGAFLVRRRGGGARVASPGPHPPG